MILDRFWIDMIGWVALGFALVSFIYKDAKKTKQMIGVSQGILAIHYAFLSAWTSAALQAVLTMRSFASSYANTMKQKNIVFGVTMVALILFTYFTWHGYISLIPFVGATIASFAFCYCGNKGLRGMLIVSNSWWLCNAIIWGSLPLIIAEVLKITFNAGSLYVIMRDEKREKEKVGEKVDPVMTEEGQGHE